MALKLGPQRDWVKNIARQFKVVPHIERAIDTLGEFEWSAEFGAKAGDDAWHPSGDCTPSLLDLYLKATGEGEHRPIGVPLRKTFQVGHFWHAYLQEVMVRAEMVERSSIERRGMVGWGDLARRHFQHVGDVPWAAWHWVTGSIDVANYAVPGHGEAVVDFKTMNSMDFKKQDAPTWTADKWECQLNIYMDWTDSETAFIVCIDKGSPHEFKEFTYERNQPLIDALYQKWELVAECVMDGVQPPADEEFPLPLRGHNK
ncbi:hypothetical protein [Candidatus Solirubrobacter pratensis]|uniref:hypothetical protein n=1 Tax=Candidatus Solirubrobacter pratensis TaxID=1298857 RepID=UPI0003F5F535|nr:hypothetical protein [Candidatus Solirubrobacter pratensis]